MKIYTKTGDDGETSLVDGTRVGKNHLRLRTYGSLDELNSHVGMLIVHLKQNEKLFSQDIDFLVVIQNKLFDMGSHLALSDESMRDKLPVVDNQIIEQLENSIDELSKELPELRNFILPGGSQCASQAHICRTICRRAERVCVDLNASVGIPVPVVKILNRMSDYFFVLARAINHRLNIPTPEWKPQ